MTEHASCAYTHDTSDDERDVDIFEQMDADEWSCQHPVRDSTEYCVFHQPVEQKDNEEVVERFVEVINTGYEDYELPPRERFRFIGSEFGDLSLPLFCTLATSGQFNPAAAEYPINLQDARVEGALHWAQTTIRHSILFDGAFVGGEINFSEATIEGDCSFTATRVASLLRLDEVEISGTLSFNHATVELAVTMAGAVVDETVSFVDSHVHAPEGGDKRVDSEDVDPGDIYARESKIGNILTIADAKIEGKIRLVQSKIENIVGAVDADIGESVNFEEVEIGDWAWFEGATIGESVNFKQAVINDSATFEGTEIGDSAEFSDAHIGDSAEFEKADIGDSVEFSDAHIGDSAEFSDAHIGDSAEFEKTDIGDSVEFSDAHIGDSAEFERADIGGSVNFQKSTILESAIFEKAVIGEKVNFEDATPKFVSLQDASFPDNTTISGDFDKRPLLTGLKVDGTLTLALTCDSDASTVIDLTGTTAESIALDGVHSHVINLADVSLERIDTGDLPDADVLYRWSLLNLKFNRFEFTESRDALNSIDWNFHKLNEEAREALAREAVRDRTTVLTNILVDLFIGIPSLSRRFVETNTPMKSGESILTNAAEIVFTDTAIRSAIVDDYPESVAVIDDPVIQDLSSDNDWTYSLDVAIAVLNLREEIETDPDFADVLTSDPVASQLEDFARQVLKTDPDVGPDVEHPPEEQVNTDTLPTRELKATIEEQYADPRVYRAENNPEQWETTYLNAKNAASEQGLNDMAAEFFLQEKRFKRKRRAQHIREGSPAERAKATFDWVSNLTMDVTTGYGERPRNVVVTSFVTVGAFTAIYAGLHALGDGATLGEYLIFSFQSFIAFIIGTSPAESVPVRIASAVQGFLGAFLIALFVFTLTRSLNR